MVPAWNEDAADLRRTLCAVHDLLRGDDELILVDAGPGVGPALTELGRLRVLPAPRGRGAQMNLGARAARGEWLVFLHADSLLTAGALEAVRALPDEDEWGWFTLCLDAEGLGYRVIEGGIRFRSWASGGATGDQAIFLRRPVFEALGGYAAWPLFEDVDLVDRLRRRSPGRRLDERVVTSSRRYRARGQVRTTLRMWALRVAYRCGASPARLAQHYGARTGP